MEITGFVHEGAKKQSQRNLFKMLTAICNKARKILTRVKAAMQVL